MQEIGAVNFYGGRPPVPKALRQGPGREAALRASRRDQTKLYALFYTQAEAFKFADARPELQLCVWAYEVDCEGKRRYVASSYTAFWRWYARALRRTARLHFYEVIRESTACRLYFDLEFLRVHNPNVDGNQLLKELCDVVVTLAPGCNTDHVVLNSTTSKKWSIHLIFSHISFYDNVQAGEFATRVTEELGETALVSDADGRKTSFVDLAVYSRNRCFRLVASSKFGKSARFLPQGHPVDGRLCIGGKLFFDTLVCNVSSNSKLLGSPRPSSGNKTTYTSRTTPQNGKKHVELGDRTATKLDEYILSIVGPNGIYACTDMRGAKSYAIKGSYKYCANIGRHHKSNNVILVVDIVTRKCYQKCFDPDCGNFTSDSWDVPSTVFEESIAGYDEDGISDEALNEMMDRFDERIGNDSGVLQPTGGQPSKLTDDMLNDFMDKFEANYVDNTDQAT